MQVQKFDYPQWLEAVRIRLASLRPDVRVGDLDPNACMMAFLAGESPHDFASQPLLPLRASQGPPPTAPPAAPSVPQPLAPSFPAYAPSEAPRWPLNLGLILFGLGATGIATGYINRGLSEGYDVLAWVGLGTGILGLLLALVGLVIRSLRPGPPTPGSVIAQRGKVVALGGLSCVVVGIGINTSVLMTLIALAGFVALIVGLIVWAYGATRS